MKTSIPKTKLTKLINTLIEKNITPNTKQVDTDEYLLIHPFNEEIVIPKKNTQLSLKAPPPRNYYNDNSIVYKNRSKIKSIHANQIENIKNNITRNSLIVDAVTNYTVLQFKEFNSLIDEIITKYVGSIDKFVDHINTLYEKHGDIELLNAIKKVNSNQIAFREYVYANQARDVFIEMSKKSANKIPLLAYMKDENVRRDIPEEEIIHPGQIITAVKKTYNIHDNVQWRTFLKFTPKVISYPETHIYILLAINETKVNKKLSKLIDVATIPSILRSLYRQQHQYHSLEHPTPEDLVLLDQVTTNLDHFINFIKLIYNADIDMGNFQYTASDMLDYITAIHRETGLYPKHYTWNAYIRNSRDWHFAQRRRRAIQNAGNKIYEWNSLLPELTLDDYKITPLTDSPSLIAEGEVMRHCVGSYWRQAINNNYRLFHIEHTEDPKDTGTLCLIPSSDNNVNIGQLRSHHNANVSSELLKIAKRISIRYRNMLKRTDKRLHIWNRTLDGITNEILETTGFPEEDVTKTITDTELTDLDENDDTTQN